MKGLVGLSASSEERCRLGDKESYHGVYASGGTGQSKIKEKGRGWRLCWRLRHADLGDGQVSNAPCKWLSGRRRCMGPCR